MIERRRFVGGLGLGFLAAPLTAQAQPAASVHRLGLVIDLKTAKTLGLTIPQSVLGRANEIIE